MDTVLPVKMREMKEKHDTFFLEIYILQLRTGTSYIVAADENIIIDGQEFIAVPFQRQNITRSMDNITDSCEITLADCSYELLAFVIDGFDFRGSMCTVWRVLYPDILTDSTQRQWLFSGAIDEPAFADGVFTCKIMSRFPQIECPNRSYQLACNNDFGDECCRASLMTTHDRVISGAGNTLKVGTSYTENYWKNGVASTAGESRLILASSGNTLTLNVNFLENLTGKTITLERGCNKTHEDCERFNNTRNYGGFPAIPFESEYR